MTTKTFAHQDLTNALYQLEIDAAALHSESKECGGWLEDHGVDTSACEPAADLVEKTRALAQAILAQLP